jgi:hypothetical protein
MQNVTPVAIAVLLAELAPAVAFGLATERMSRSIQQWPRMLRLFAPATLAAFYAIVASSAHIFRWEWLALYSTLPVVMAWVATHAAAADPEQRGNWRDALILFTLGLAVDLRWLDSGSHHFLNRLQKYGTSRSGRELGRGLDQAARVWVLRPLGHLPGISGLDDFPAIHHGNAGRKVAHDGHRMGNE